MASNVEQSAFFQNRRSKDAIVVAGTNTLAVYTPLELR
jgi:hypothetical protein